MSFMHIFRCFLNHVFKIKTNFNICKHFHVFLHYFRFLFLIYFANLFQKLSTLLMFHKYATFMDLVSNGNITVDGRISANSEFVPASHVGDYSSPFFDALFLSSNFCFVYVFHFLMPIIDKFIM
jgi:hypothetical protein